jgi:hypothetical protein
MNQQLASFGVELGRTQSGAAGGRAMAVEPVLAVPFAPPYPSQSKQKKTDNPSATEPAVPFTADT